MIIRKNPKVRVFTIQEVPALDPVTVILEDDYGIGQGRLTVICYGSAWTAYWGGMGTHIGEFVLQASTHYLVEKLLPRDHYSLAKKVQKHNEAYLLRVVEAVKAGVDQYFENDDE